MQPITINKTLKIIKLWLAGLSYDEISQQTGVSKGKIHDVIQNLKNGLIPQVTTIQEDIDLIRDLAINLKHSSISAAQASVGFSVLEKLTALKLEPFQIEKVHTLLNALTPPDIDLAVMGKSILTIENVKAETGLSLGELEAKVVTQKKDADMLEPVSKELTGKKKELDQLGKEVTGLTGMVKDFKAQEANLSNAINNLETKETQKIKLVIDLEERVHTADEQLTAARKDLEMLTKLGMNKEQLGSFNIKLKEVASHHNVKPENLSNYFLKQLVLLDKGLELDTKIKNKQNKLDSLKKQIPEAEAERGSLQKDITQLKAEEDTLKASVAHYHQQLVEDIKAVSLATRKAIQEINSNLETGIQAGLKEVDKVTDKALGVGKLVGKLESDIEAMGWIKPVLALAKGETGIEARQVRIASLSILRPISQWFQDQPNGVDYLLKTFIDSAIGRLEEWKTQ
ncbi:hypothetical protein ACFLYB_01420 [Chloroflexota bacterium]